MSGTQQQKRVYSITEVAAILGIGLRQAYEAAHRGDFPTLKIGKRLLVPIVAFSIAGLSKGQRRHDQRRAF